MAPRNVARPDAMNVFNCVTCNKGYSRQIDYENHLRSYDHTHNQRLADLKKLTASNDPNSSKPKAGPEMRGIDLEAANRRPGTGRGFTKLGGARGAGTGGSGFKKVGVPVVEKKESAQLANAKMEESPVAKVPKGTTESTGKEAPIIESDYPADYDSDAGTLVGDAVEEEEEEEKITWKEYDFIKPTGCDLTTCKGCKTDGIWSGKWLSA